MSKESIPKDASNREVLSWIETYQSTEGEEVLTNLVLHFRYLVESIARKYSYGRALHDDMVQVGMLGLLGAIRRFDPSLGGSFEAFAVPTIVGEVKRFLRDKTWDVHVPRRIKELGPKIKIAVDTLTAQLQYSPSIQEIAEYLQVQEEDVLEAMEMGKHYQALSMNHSIEPEADGGGTITLLDIVGKEDEGFERTNRRMLVSEVIDVLSDREKQVIQLTYLEEMSQKEVGEKIGISQMHVSRIQRKAIKKLQEAINSTKIS